MAQIPRAVANSMVLTPPELRTLLTHILSCLTLDPFNHPATPFTLLIEVKVLLSAWAVSPQWTQTVQVKVVFPVTAPVLPLVCPAIKRNETAHSAVSLSAPPLLHRSGSRFCPCRAITGAITSSITRPLPAAKPWA